MRTFFICFLCLVNHLAISQDKIEIEYLAHSSFKIHAENKTILLDPFADKIWIGYNFPENQEADAVFSTHPHYDHDGGIFLGFPPYWKDKIPFYSEPGNYSIGKIKVKGIKGKHSDPYGKEFKQKNTIWIIEVAGIRIAHLGDNGPLSEENLKELTAIDILMIPIDAQYHILKKEELKTVINQVKPRIIIPMHYKIPELEEDPEALDDLGILAPYLKGRNNVVKLETNKLTIKKEDIPLKQRYFVFKHSPLVTK
ncbi:hypothetical protein GTQ40_05030 [Flavobacteriaceae bacterium R38]|nr:hypothetical protein [Flavobacteriaceae bacterium R38]